MKSCSQSRNAFTLVEVLVSIAVLTIILMMATQITISARDTTTTSQGFIDAERQVGRVFDQVQRDFDSMLLRGDIPWEFEKEEGYDRFAFFTQRAGYSVNEEGISDRRLSLASYRVINGELQRGSIGMSFGDKGETGNVAEGLLVLREDASLPIPPEENFQALSDGVLQFEVGFISRIANSATSSRQLPNRLKDLRAVTVTLVTIDPKARRVLTDEQFESVRALFPEPADGTQAGEEWTEVSENILSRGRGLPESALKRVRVTHRIFPIQS